MQSPAATPEGTPPVVTNLQTILLALALPLAACRAEAEPNGEFLTSSVPDGPVIDAANLLPAAEEAELDAQLRTLWEDEETALVVSTVTTLEGETIEDFAHEQFNEWGIGSDETHRGILILVAPFERQARIEVGCGMETVITDPVAQRIIDEELIPQFRDGDFAGGIIGGVNALISEIETSTVEPGPVSNYCVELMGQAG